MNSKNLTLFESQNLLNIIVSIKNVFIDVVDLYNTTCFVIKNKEDENMKGYTLCSINNDEKYVWIQDIKAYSETI